LAFSFYRLAGILLVLCTCLRAEAQGAEQGAGQAGSTAQPDLSHLQQVPRVPGVGSLLRGFSAGVTFSGVHDSSVGWYAVTTPAVSYNFSPHYSADASLSIYPYRLVQSQDPQADRRLVKATGELGDTLIGVHVGFNPGKFWNTATGSFTVPTGNRTDGLSTGKVTFDFSNRLERYFNCAGLLVDLGVGDSSGLFNSVVTKDYNSLGPLAHFQTGVVLLLPSRSYIQSVAYEQLPFDSQTIYTAPGPPGAPTYTVVFFLLVANVFPNRGLIAPYCRHEISPRPKALTSVILFPFSVHPRQVDRALALDVPHHLRHRIFGRYRNHHVHMVCLKMPLFNPALSLLGQLLEHFAQMLPKALVQHLPAALRDENNVVFALPYRVA
jgi:hypothetical protein